MRRREKFVLAALVLSLGLLGVQYVSLEWRYLAVALLSIVSYFVSAWALSDDLQPVEWLTIVPLPALYAGAIGAFYFLLPANFASRALDLGLFGVGMYALYLTSNIYSVAKGRTIQLLRAAHTIGLFFTLLMSLLMTNTIYSHHLPFYINGPLVAALHFPLVFLFLWSVKLESKIEQQTIIFSIILTLILAEISVILSFFPFTVWHVALFVMSTMYIGLGILQSYFQERLFRNALTEYYGVGIFVAVLFFVLLNWK